MIWLLVGVFVVLCIAGAIGITLTKRWNGDFNGWCTLFVVGTVMTLIFLPVVAYWTMANGVELARWQAFDEANFQNYGVAVSEAASCLSQEKFVGVVVRGSLERFEQAGYVSERVREWRDAVNQRNLAIASMQYFNRNIFTGTMVPDAVEDMKMLLIK